MLNTKKILAFLFLFVAIVSAVVSSSVGEETVPGSFITRGERSVPVITVLGLYNANGTLVNPGGGSVTPNTKHSIRFRVSNDVYALTLENTSIRVAFFQSYNNGDESDFDNARTDIYGDALVVRVDSQGTRIIFANQFVGTNDVSWDDNHFSNANHKVDFGGKNSYEFEIYFNMSKVASGYDQYYIGVTVDQTIGTDTFETYEAEGHYNINSYTEFNLDTTNLSIDWRLDDTLGSEENFFDFNGYSSSSRETLDGSLFTVISNVDIELDIYADTTWSGQDLDDPNNPDAIVSAELVDGTPSFAQEFAIYFSGGYNTSYVSGNSRVFDYINRTTEGGSNAGDLSLDLELFFDNFENGIYNGNFYFTATEGLL